MLLKIVLGLFGLGIVVFIHELGHFLSAKMVGVEVEVFSIGWGKKLFGFMYKGTEYRISLFPVGGYCKMKGDDQLKEAITNGAERIPHEEHAFYSVSPWKRIIVLLAGPTFNLLFSVVALAFIWYIGFSFATFDNRIVLASDVSNSNGTREAYPADQAGLRTGDEIVAVENEEVLHFRDIQERIATSPGERISLTVQRDGGTRTIEVVPRMNTETGAGFIGIHVWIEPVIDEIEKDSPAWIAGLRKDDRIVAVDGKPIEHALELNRIISDRPDAVKISYERNGQQRTTTLVIRYDDAGNPQLGISYRPRMVHTPSLNPIEAIGKGFEETIGTLVLYGKSLALLFRGVDLTQAVTGPIRITYIVGEVASQGLTMGVRQGLASIVNFLSFLSVALFFMNLLPIPALDGGFIALFLIEGIIGRPLKPKVIYRFQIVGVFIIFLLIILATMGDLFFFLNN